MPDSPNAVSTCFSTTPRWNWRADRLTATIRSGWPASCQARSCCVAVLSTQPPRLSIRPLSSASGIKIAGGMEPSSGSSQRHRASPPSIRPLDNSTSGWYSSRITFDSIARRKADSICNRSSAASFMAAFANWYAARPLRLAAYKAVSASANSTSNVSPSAGNMATPTDREMLIGKPPITVRSPTTSIRWRALWAASAVPCTSGTSTMNSSPLRRPTTACEPAARPRRNPTSRSIWSPAAWPSESFKVLKLSMSTTISAACCPANWPWPSAIDARRAAWVRLGSPVTTSWVDR